MYLELKRGSTDAELKQITCTVLRLFKYLSSVDKLDLNELKKAYRGKDNWLIQYCNRSQNFVSMLEEYIELPKTDRVNIFQAFLHDMVYKSHIDDDTFAFRQRAIPKSQLDMAFVIWKMLYENPFKNSIQLSNHKDVSYEKMRKGLEKANSVAVCPVCLGKLENFSKDEEVDHYLPKAKYPGLTIYPSNLALICATCNGSSYKGEKDPLMGGNLTEAYLPYLRAAESETQIKITGSKGNRRMKLVPKVPSKKVDKRIENLDNLFKLEDRWTARMKDYETNELNRIGRSERFKSVSDVEAELDNKAVQEAELADVCEENRIRAITASFLNGRGRQAFLNEWERRQEEARRMREL